MGPRPFGEIIDALPVVAFECEPSGALLAISGSWAELTGQPVEAALGEGWLAHLDVAGLVGLRGRRGEALERLLRVKDAAGTWRRLRVVCRSTWEGETCTRLTALGTLVPAAEETEAELREALEVARRHAAEGDALLEAWPDLVFVITGDGGFSSFRAADPGWLYAAPEQFLGRTFEQVLPPALAEQARDALERARAERTPQSFLYELSLPPGRRHFEARVLPTRRADFLFVIRDITEARRSQEALIVAREDALERNRLKTQFLANVSHEIRTPLNGILGVTQLLQQHTLPADVADYVDVLKGAGESLLVIVNDVLDLSRIEANRLRLEPRPFDLEQLVQETAKSFFPLLQRKRLTLAVEVAPDAKGPVRGDPTRVRQIVTNLVGNAVKFTDVGAVKVSVRRLEGDRVELSVRDTGPGIAPEHHERIFLAFEQADADVQRRYGGTGLGLAITRQLARLMGGEVTLTSAPGEGSTFMLVVPLEPVVITPASTVASRVTPVPRPLRVLLAEDEPVNATMTAALLRKLGHQVRVVENGEACVTAALGGDVDLVLMDVQMPVLDGLEATGRIRAAEKGTEAHLPIVALTANAMKGDDVRCLSAGMDAYLSKPVTVAALKDILLWFGGQQR